MDLPRKPELASGLQLVPGLSTALHLHQFSSKGMEASMDRGTFGITRPTRTRGGEGEGVCGAQHTPARWASLPFPGWGGRETQEGVGVPRLRHALVKTSEGSFLSQLRNRDSERASHLLKAPGPGPCPQHTAVTCYLSEGPQAS